MNRYTVIIPVFNALEHVKRCLESVLANTPEDVWILVIDDCSTDAEVLRYLKKFDAPPRGQVTAWYNRSNLGFVRTANHGIAKALEVGTEPILLNSDTIVPPRWIERLDEAREAATARGLSVCSVSPLSNKCTQYSVPNQWDGELPEGINVEEMDCIVKDLSSNAFPVVVTNVGFCMLLTRVAIDAVGVFDTKWGKGYGEETDWCERAKLAGFSCILADNVYVYHKHRASFGSKANSQWKENEKLFEEQYPNFRTELERENLSHPLTAHRLRIADTLRPRTADRKTRVMYVCHNWGKLGGLEIFQSRLVEELAHQCEINVLHPRRGDMVESTTFVQHPNGVLRIVMSPRLTEREIDLSIFPFQLRAPLVENWFRTVVEEIQPDVVHFQHLGGWGTFRLPEIASHYAKTVLSLHDWFYLCPSYLEAGWKCGRNSAMNCEQCRACVEKHWTVRVAGRHSEKLGDMLEQRKREVERMFAHVNVVTAPSDSLRSAYDEHVRLVRSLAQRIVIVPHGVPRYPYVGTYQPASKVRVAWVGGVLPEKGWNAFRGACIELKDDPRFEFSVLGERSELADCSGLQHVTFVGRYKPEQLPQLLQRVDLAIPAVARKESYGLVVDECLVARCPILLPDVATMRERMSTFSVWYEWGNAGSLVDELEKFNAHVAEYSNEERIGARRGAMPGVRTMFECAAEYAMIYLQLRRDQLELNNEQLRKLLGI